MENRMPPSIDTATKNSWDRNPQWWTAGHTTAWERVQQAFRRDWEQTKVDLSRDGQTLNQNVGDTVKQALGTDAVPPPGVKTHPTDPDVAAKALAKDAEKHSDDAKTAAKTAAKGAAKAADESAYRTQEATKAAAKDAEHTAKRDLEATKAATKATVKDAEMHMDAVKDAGKAHVAMDKENAKAAAAIGAASAKIADAVGDVDEAIAKRERAVARWNQAEQEARYGYAARSQHAGVQAWDDSLDAKLHTDWDALATGRTWEESRDGVRRGWDYAAPNRA